MACNNNPVVLLGYDDEQITEKHIGQINFTTNKVGGKPDFPNQVNIENTNCPLCHLLRPLVLQIYAPLENSTYHRILYLFACINPNCWNQNDSWLCLRVQTLEQLGQTSEFPNTSKTTNKATDWCEDADDWGDSNNSNLNEENGNVICNIEKGSDEEEESCSFEDSFPSGFGNLSIDDKNANNGTADKQGVGAVGRLHSPAATAEIEGDEGEVISIDTPTIPQRDITSLLQEVPTLPQELLSHGAQNNLKRSPSLQFVPYFMNVWEESNISSGISDKHIRELLHEYQQNTEEEMDLSSPECKGGGDLPNMEKYEKSDPAHGDKMFHYFLSKIQMNPGQIMRYSRDERSLLLLYPLQEIPKKCQYCEGDMIFEFQVLPTLIPKLRLSCDERQGSRIEFGTVLVFTCKRSCWSTDANFQKECVIVQTERY